MAIKEDVIDYAILLGGYDSSNTEVINRIGLVTDMMILKTEQYIGYYPPTALTNIIAEMVVRQYVKETIEPVYPTKEISRGDYTVQYDTSIPTVKVEALFNEYEWILRKYKKLKTL